MSFTLNKTNHRCCLLQSCFCANNSAVLEHVHGLENQWLVGTVSLTWREAGAQRSVEKLADVSVLHTPHPRKGANGWDVATWNRVDPSVCGLCQQFVISCVCSRFLTSVLLSDFLWLHKEKCLCPSDECSDSILEWKQKHDQHVTICSFYFYHFTIMVHFPIKRNNIK